jgi:hypothetical protein
MGNNMMYTEEQLNNAIKVALDHCQRKMAKEVEKSRKEGEEAERKRCCAIIFGMCESDNVAQRTVNKIWGK